MPDAAIHVRGLGLEASGSLDLVNLKLRVEFVDSIEGSVRSYRDLGEVRGGFGLQESHRRLRF